MLELHLGDCFEIMATMPDKSVDHIITDPPYSDRVHKGARGGNEAKKTLHQNNSLIAFKCFTEDDFINFCTEGLRITKRWMILTCDSLHAAQAEKEGLPVIRVGAWIKPNSAPQFTGDRPGVGWETVLILHPEGKKKWNDGGHHAVWIYNIVHGQHPTKKPPALIKKWIEQFTDLGETIFDPFMGEGTVGECALQMGRNFKGVEIEPGWYELAKQQIEAQESQLVLF